MGIKIILAVLLVTLVGGVAIWFFVIKSPNRQITPPQPSQNRVNNQTSGTNSLESPTVLAQNLEIPWEMAILPNNEMLVTERPGSIKLIKSDGKIQDVGKIDEVLHIGEGGLLGIALHPGFENNNYIYVYYTYAENNNQTLNRVIRFTLKNNTLSEKKVIVDKIPGARFHNGGRIKFGPDNFLYITTGDAQNPSLSQDKNSLAGKILRTTDEGDPAPGNPFNNEVYSYGHRNPQGLAWDDKNGLWATEHGPSTQDELNKIEVGKNYGWPIISGEEQKNGMVSPIIQSGNDTWAPAGLTFYGGKLYFAGLRGNALFSFDPNTPQAGVKEHFKGKFGRLRGLILGPDNNLYLTTSNKDGRGTPASSDDRIFKVNPKKL